MARNIIHQNIAEYKHFCTKFSDRVHVVSKIDTVPDRLSSIAV